MARCLEALGHEVVVADPNFASMYATLTRKVKTDRRDARPLQEACLLGAYRPAHRLSDAQRHVRGRLAVRDALVPTRTGSIVLIRALLRRHGWRVPTGSAGHQLRLTMSCESGMRQPGNLPARLAEEPIPGARSRLSAVAELVSLATVGPWSLLYSTSFRPRTTGAL